jgi:ferritin-like metal-binding protein YciE
MKILKFVDTDKSGFYSEVPAAAKKTLKDMFTDSLSSMKWSERELEYLLLKIKAVADNETMYKTIQHYISLSCTKLNRIEQIFNVLNQTSNYKRNATVEGLIKEAEIKTAKHLQGTVCDMTILMILQFISQYKITHYSFLASIAKTMRSVQINTILYGIIEEEKLADDMIGQVISKITDI